MILSIFTFSCRKVKMKDEKEKLVGTWIIKTSCNESTGCDNNNTGITVIVYKNGLIDKTGGSLNLNEHGRFVKMKEKADPSIQVTSPMLTNFYEVKIRKSSWNDSCEELKELKSIRYSNGYFNSSGVFVQEEELFLCKEPEGAPNYSIYIRK